MAKGDKTNVTKRKSQHDDSTSTKKPIKWLNLNLSVKPAEKTLENMNPSKNNKVIPETPNHYSESEIDVDVLSDNCTINDDTSPSQSLPKTSKVVDESSTTTPMHTQNDPPADQRGAVQKKNFFC